MMIYRVVVFLMVLKLIIGCSNSNEINSGCLSVEKAVFKAEMKNNNNFQLIDVRTPDEYNNGTIENSQNINFYDEDFNEQISHLDKSIPTFVYCQAGGRSYEAMVIMCELGFTTVFELEGGYSSWH
mgnify:CR=1 FL=1